MQMYKVLLIAVTDYCQYLSDLFLKCLLNVSLLQSSNCSGGQHVSLVSVFNLDMKVTFQPGKLRSL